MDLLASERPVEATMIAPSVSKISSMKKEKKVDMTAETTIVTDDGDVTKPEQI
jgi:P pilus assembly chaperone PapD